jgi:hypothetical protein
MRIKFYYYSLITAAVMTLNVFAVSTQLPAQGKPIELRSSNGELKVSISLGDKIYYPIAANNQDLLTKNHLNRSGAAA